MEFEHLYLEILSPLFWNMDTFNLNLKELNVYITLVSIYHSSAQIFLKDLEKNVPAGKNVE